MVVQFWAFLGYFLLGDVMKRNLGEFRDSLFDSHMHFGVMLSSLFDDKMPFCQNLSGIMDILGLSRVNRGIVFPFPNDFIGNDLLNEPLKNTYVRDVFEEIPYFLQNQRLLLEVEKISRGEILPFLMCSVKYGVDAQIRFLKECVNDKYVYGLKYYADADNIPLREFVKHGEKIIEFLIEYDLPIVFHTSANTVINNGGISCPDDILNIAMLYPELRICIAHMAHFSKNVFNRLQSNDFPNVYLDTSPFLHLCNIRNVVHSKNCLELPYNNPNAVLEKLTDLIPNQIIWGSDYPFNFTCNLNNPAHDKDYNKYTYSQNINVLESLSDDKIKRIANINTLKFLFGEESYYAI